MSGGYYVLDMTFTASEALTQFQAVTLDTAGTISAADAQGERIIGICQETITAGDVTNGRAVSVRVLGVSRAVANGAINPGAIVTASADGSLEAVATGDFPVGVCVASQAVADNDQFDVLLTPPGGVASA